MSTTPGGWLPLILTTLGAGAVGSIITTYGAQGRVRREARSRAMAALEHIDSARHARLVGEGFTYPRQAFAELEACCMVAGVPRRLFYWLKALLEAAAGPPSDPGPIIATFHLIDYSSFLIQQSLWHLILSRIARPFRIRRLLRIINRCSKISKMSWLCNVDLERDIARLGPVRRWIKEVEQHQL